MRVSKIEVQGLFGIFDHVIPLNLDDHITIIHGPNGIGKTILLQMVNDLCHNSLFSFTHTPFNKIEIIFDDGQNVWIEKQNQYRPEMSEWRQGIKKLIPINLIGSPRQENKLENLQIPAFQQADCLADKIRLFMDIINQRFLYKQIKLSKENGFSFITNDGESLTISSLSAGERHALDIFYKLIFKTPSNSCILIDEPELSLHVAWQQQFLHDLQRIIQLSPFDVLIATHSPQIIHNRWDLTVELKDVRNDFLQ